MPNESSFPVWPGGGWETVRLIGRGSYGAVYEIRRVLFGNVEQAAMKMLSVPQSDSDVEELFSEGYDHESVTETFTDQMKSVVAEYTLMRELNGNTNVVNCDDVQFVRHDDGIGWDIFIRMELLRPLTRVPESEITDGQIIRLGRDLCRALQLCAAREIIHRDIKPANIFVSSNWNYKLGDFGIAKVIERTSGGTKIGTYDYMAPEVYHDKPYGSAADIYSLGLVLYWLLNERRLPFQPSGKVTVSERELARRRRLQGEPLPPPAHGSAELKRIVLKACAFEPRDRYSSAEEMLRDLERLKTGADPEIIASSPKESAVHTKKSKDQAGNQTRPGPSMADGSADPTIGIFSGNSSAASEEETVLIEHAAWDDRSAPIEKPKERNHRKAGFIAGGIGLVAVAAIVLLLLLPKAGRHAPAPPESTAAMSAVSPSPTPTPTPAPTPSPALEAITYSMDANGRLTIHGSGILTKEWISVLEITREQVTSVQIDHGITEISSDAFNGCSNLANISIPDSVTSIGSWAFNGCNRLSSVTIPDAVTSIGDSAFNGCNSLSSVTIPDAVTSIGDSAFSGCNSLSSVTIPDAVTSIGDSAFRDCSNLTSVTIPDAVTSIGDSTFEGCSNLTSVTIPDSVTSIGSWAFYRCGSLTNVTISDSITSIGSWAFSGCNSLSSVTIPDAVTSIGDSAFRDCSSLSSVTIPDAVTSIGDSTFQGCSSLTSVTIPDSVTSIGGWAFRDCSSLSSVTIPDSVTSIGDFAFGGCSSLTDIYYSGTESQWAAISIEENNEPLQSAAVHYNSN